VENNLPDVLYTYPNPINAGEVAVFDASKTMDVETPFSGLEFEWTFGDGSTGKGARVEHTYKQHGAIKLTLNVKDGDGGTSIKDMTEVINALPDIQVTANQAAGGYQVLGRWTPQTFSASGATADYNISPFCKDAAQYEVVFRKAGGQGDLQGLEGALWVGPQAPAQVGVGGSALQHAGDLAQCLGRDAGQGGDHPLRQVGRGYDIGQGAQSGRGPLCQVEPPPAARALFQVASPGLLVTGRQGTL
jgi:hypothetical protein